MVGRKRSGKTNVVISTIIRSAGPATKVMIFSSTVNSDPNWAEAKEMFEEMGIVYETFTSITEGKTNHLAELCEYLEAPLEQESDSDADPSDIGIEIAMDGKTPEEEEAEREPETDAEPEKLAPRFIIVIDDLSTELKDPQVASLMKRNRHFGVEMLVGSQNYKDLIGTGARDQINYMLLWKGIRVSLLREIHAEKGPPFDFETFLAMYTAATGSPEEPHQFLYCGIRDDDYRIGFSMRFKLHGN